jgi:pimeloyl-ACP methyl ester carboxylesterase
VGRWGGGAAGRHGTGGPVPSASMDEDHRTLRVEVADGTRLHVLVWDPPAPTGSPTPDASPFLLVHGLASNALLWTGVASALAAAGHRVVAVDQRAHGRSDPSDRLDLATLTADLVAVAAALGLDRPIAVGQSWGGNVVLELAHRYPAAVRAVAAVDGGTIELRAAFPDRDACWAALAPPRWDGGLTLATVTAGLAQRYPDWPEAGRWAQLGNLAVRPDGGVVAILTRARHRTIVDGLYDHVPSRFLHEVDVPVLLLPVDTGETGWTAGKRAATEAATERLPRGRTVWFTGHDHDVHAQAPTAVAAALLGAVGDGFLDPDDPGPDPEGTT